MQISQGKYYLVRKQDNCQSILDSLWMLIKDKYFICIHLLYDEKLLLKSFELDTSQSTTESSIDA